MTKPPIAGARFRFIRRAFGGAQSSDSNDKLGMHDRGSSLYAQLLHFSPLDFNECHSLIAAQPSQRPLNLVLSSMAVVSSRFELHRDARLTTAGFRSVTGCVEGSYPERRLQASFSTGTPERGGTPAVFLAFADARHQQMPSHERLPGLLVTWFAVIS